MKDKIKWFLIYELIGLSIITFLYFVLYFNSINKVEFIFDEIFIGIIISILSWGFTDLLLMCKKTKNE